MITNCDDNRRFVKNNSFTLVYILIEYNQSRSEPSKTYVKLADSK